MTKNEDLKACYITDLQWKILHEIKCKVSALEAQPACKILASDLEMWIYNIKDSPSATRPTVTPDDSAMEDNTGRSGSNGMASVEGSTPSLPNPSPADGDVDGALKMIKKKGACHAFGDCYHINQAEHDILLSALQSTRKPINGDAERALKWFNGLKGNPPPFGYYDHDKVIRTALQSTRTVTDGDAERALERMSVHARYSECLPDYNKIKSALQSTRKPPEILSVDDAEKFLFQNSMLSMHGAHETINKFIKRFPHGIRIEE